MRTTGFTNTKKITSLAATALLTAIAVAPATSLAAIIDLDPAMQLGSIPEAGAPSFIFNDSVTTTGGGKGFSADIQSWFDNYSVVRSEEDGYSFTAHNEGNFTFLGTLTDDYNDVSTYSGVSGIFDLKAMFDASGNLLAGGTVQITGAINALDILDPATVLMSADLVRYELTGNLLGFAINNIVCDPAINFCAANPDQEESVYFSFDTALTGIGELNGQSFRATMTSQTTVPIPAAAWLMLSGLGWIGFMATRRKS